MRVFAIGASWGGTHSLIVPMSVWGDRSCSPWTEDGPILRISVGLEDPAALWSELAALFEALDPTKV